MHIPAPLTEPLKPFPIAPFSGEILDVLETAGFVSPLLYGGALRDQYIGRPDLVSDYDIKAGWLGVLPLEEQKSYAPAIDRISHEIKKRGPLFAESVVQHGLSRIPGISYYEIMWTDWPWQWAPNMISFIYKGASVSLFEDLAPTLPLNERLYADAPINAIAMDATGEIVAHRRFKDHIEQSLYAPFRYFEGDTPRGPLAWRGRYTKMHAKFPDLRYRKPAHKTEGPHQ